MICKCCTIWNQIRSLPSLPRKTSVNHRNYWRFTLFLYNFLYGYIPEGQDA